ncbi:hypothetical protein JEM51_02005 [Ligilactobacillus agilis]|uniref:hypothetical protein n=1 Tax=Ligilactobacillus agilis TaxID=1601 RepID=UPI00191F137D|nr:hypothetical protein [Ligilactobacillus agilis]MBL1055212.1 hypothetical protein [Ligilactobacillus agilis]
MKQRIENHIYDPGTAKEIVNNGRYYDKRAGDFYFGKLYLNRTGEFFFVTYININSYPFGPEYHPLTIPLTFDEARKVEVLEDPWGHKDDAKFKELFEPKESEE